MLQHLDSPLSPGGYGCSQIMASRTPLAVTLIGCRGSNDPALLAQQRVWVPDNLSITGTRSQSRVSTHYNLQFFLLTPVTDPF
uniref:Uncharacterized protein n=1 Tax=Engystomops pustulosus TaxID=76066 RepID=A0AAV6Z2T7_ENGPU|nr:hypothetical protein GDO81_028533 [Engystomops pustulosus]